MRQASEVFVIKKCNSDFRLVLGFSTLIESGNYNTHSILDAKSFDDLEPVIPIESVFKIPRNR